MKFEYSQEDYEQDKVLLDDLDRRIISAPRTSVPVFAGIVRLHDRVKRYEREQARHKHHLSVK